MNAGTWREEETVIPVEMNEAQREQICNIV